ncbi:substrate-binding periplasmic protein [Agarivorans sp. QJM3NY_33]|uniref:substrate-binding periplasmic protein n=1 Tax=Agarivorans sp. QJM3NY_33 TaxID=3421432 RepID=UPI003D7CF206
MSLRIVVLLFFLAWPVAAMQMVTANANWPPWRVIEADGSLSGIEIDILKQLSQALDLELKTQPCGWKRCLKYMELGESDVMTGLYKNDERAQYMHFVEPPYRSHNDMCFYQAKIRPVQKLDSYSDLYSLTIGVLNKVAYFEQFDQDLKLFKHYATTDESLFRLLLGGRIDTLIMSCIEGDIFLKQRHMTDIFEHTNYTKRNYRSVYLAISKRSKLIERAAEISKHLQQMLDSGEITKILASYGVVERD